MKKAHNKIRRATLKCIFLGLDFIFIGPNTKEPEKVTDERMIETEVLMRCSNEHCRQLIPQSDLRQNGGKCPHCGETVWKTELSK